MDPEHDRQISDHVLRMHCYRGSGEQDGDGGCYVCVARLQRLGYVFDKGFVAWDIVVIEVLSVNDV